MLEKTLARLRQDIEDIGTYEQVRKIELLRRRIRRLKRKKADDCG